MAEDPKGKKEPKVKRPTPLKRDLQNEKNRIKNRAAKSQIRTAVRHFEEALEKNDAKASGTCLNDVYSLIDKAVKKGIYTVNKASRTKSRLTAHLAKRV